MAYKSLYGLPLSTPPNFLASFQTTLLSCSTPIPASLLNTESASWCKVPARTIPFTRNPLPPGIYLVGTFPQSQQVSAVTLSGSLFDPLGPKRLPILVLLPPHPPPCCIALHGTYQSLRCNLYLCITWWALATLQSYPVLPFLPPAHWPLEHPSFWFSQSIVAKLASKPLGAPGCPSRNSFLLQLVTV